MCCQEDEGRDSTWWMMCVPLSVLCKLRRMSRHRTKMRSSFWLKRTLWTRITGARTGLHLWWRENNGLASLSSLNPGRLVVSLLPYLFLPALSSNYCSTSQSFHIPPPPSSVILFQGRGMWNWISATKHAAATQIPDLWSRKPPLYQQGPLITPTTDFLSPSGLFSCHLFAFFVHFCSPTSGTISWYHSLAFIIPKASCLWSRNGSHDLCQKHAEDAWIGLDRTFWLNCLYSWNPLEQ